MPFGYSYFELFNAKEKGKFLAKHTNVIEEKFLIIFYLAGSIIFGTFFISLFFFLFDQNKYSNVFYSSFLLICCASIVSQNYRRYLLIKYKYTTKDKWWKTFLSTGLYVIGFLIALKFLFSF